MSPIEIFDNRSVEDKPLCRLQDVGSYTLLGLGEENIKVQLEKDPKRDGEIGIIVANAQEIRIERKDGSQMAEPFRTKPGDEVSVLLKDGGPARYKIRHTAR